MNRLLTATALFILFLPNAHGQPTGKLLDVNALNTDISVLLRTLAEQSGENIVIGQGVNSKVTAQLIQLPLTEILAHLTRSNGLAWTRTDNAYVVTKQEAVKPVDPPKPVPPEITSAVWQCKYATQTELMNMIQKLFPDLLVSSGPTQAAPALDSTASAVTGSAVASAQADITSSDVLRPGLLVMKGSRDSVEQAITLLKTIDIRRPQVVIEVVVSELGSEASRELGLTWGWNTISLKEAPAKGGIKFGKFTRDGMNFEAVLSAMETDGRAKLLAKPSLAVVDGGHGSILIGDRIMFPKLIGYSQYGTPIYDKEEEKVGIYLQVAPVITDDGYITMTVYPQVSVVKSYLKTQAGDYPQISTRETKTTVRLKESERLAIGGLIRDDEISTITKIPLLGDLPILKNLFRHKSTHTQRDEIVIFLTPKILPGETSEKPEN